MHDNLTMPVLPKDTCSKYFKQIDISAGTWKCKCGKVLVQKKNTGWSNLLNHVKRQHPEESANAVNNTPSVINAFAVDETSRKRRNIYGWIRIICDGMRPFSFGRHQERMQILPSWKKNWQSLMAFRKLYKEMM